MEGQTVKRIAIDARFFDTGTGVARYIKALLTHLKKLDHTNEYTVIVRPNAVAEASIGNPKNWKTIGLDIVHYSLAEQTTFLSYLNKEKFDLVYFTMFNHPIFYRGKSIIMIHDLIMHFYPPRPLWHPRTWIYRFVMWHAAHASTKIINNSETTKNDVVKYLGVPASKCVPILLAVEETFKPVRDEAKVKQVKEKFGITKPFFFFINAWRPHKGLPELVNAFLEVKKKHDVQLVVGGKPNTAFPEVISAVDAVKKQTKDIITPGYISDEEMMALMSASEAYVNPSHYEGFGLGLLEAMSCGAPVITADNACMKEIGGEAALYFKTKSSNSLAKVITTYLDNPNERDELIKKGFERIKDFSFDRMAKETLDVFNDILKKIRDASIPKREVAPLACQ